MTHGFGDLEEAAQWLGAHLAEVDAGAEYPLAVGIQTDRNVVSLELPQGRMPTTRCNGPMAALIDNGARLAPVRVCATSSLGR